jgi:hypothetical protein
MSTSTEPMDLDRINTALAKVEPEAPVRRSFVRMRTEDPDPAPVVSEKPTRRFPQPNSVKE